MHSDLYYEYKKEFRNCLLMTPVTLGISLILAFKEWKPRINEELRKEREQRV